MNEDILTLAQQWLANGSKVALVTVVQTRGLSPCPVGSHLAVQDNGDFAGSVSGGCIESTLIREALAVLDDGKVRQLEFGVSNEQAREASAACGGRVQVMVQNLANADWLDALQAARSARRLVAQVIRLVDGSQCLWEAGSCHGSLDISTDVAMEISKRISANQSGVLATDTGLFLRVYAPAYRLLVVGAVHIAQVLAPMAMMAGFDVTLIDPRHVFASNERFPGVAISHDRPDEALEKLEPDAATAVVTLSHEPNLDDPALIAALSSSAFYIGALGSIRTHAQRLQRLREQGFDNTALARIHAPVGLNLGGRLPAEIAVPILAQLIQVRYQGDA